MTQRYTKIAYELGRQAAAAEFSKYATVSPAEAAVIREELPSAVARIQEAVQRTLLGTPYGQVAVGAGAGGIAGHMIPEGQDRPGASSFARGAVGGITGGTAGALAGLPLAKLLEKNPKLALMVMLGLPIAGAVGGGYLGGRTAKTEHPTLERLGITD